MHHRVGLHSGGGQQVGSAIARWSYGHRAHQCGSAKRQESAARWQSTTRYLEQQWDGMYVDISMAGGRSHSFLVLVRETKNLIIKESVAMLWGKVQCGMSISMKMNVEESSHNVRNMQYYAMISYIFFCLWWTPASYLPFLFKFACVSPLQFFICQYYLWSSEIWTWHSDELHLAYQQQVDL